MADDINSKLKKFERLVILQVSKSGLGPEYHNECINGAMHKISKTLKKGHKLTAKTAGLYVYQKKTDIIRSVTQNSADSFNVIQNDILDWSKLYELLSKKKIKRNKRFAWVRQCLLEEKEDIFYRDLKNAKESRKRKNTQKTNTR